MRIAAAPIPKIAFTVARATRNGRSAVSARSLGEAAIELSPGVAVTSPAAR